MAGREGLVDTAVKTSRSGYLQRWVPWAQQGPLLSQEAWALPPSCIGWPRDPLLDLAPSLSSRCGSGAYTPYHFSLKPPPPL